MADESSSFLARLKQHHLYGVVVAYAVVVGFLIQLVSRAFPYFGWASAVPAVIIVLLLGFPVVVVLAWLFIKPKDPAKSDTWQRRHWKLGAAVTITVIVLVVISGFYGLQFSERRVERLAASAATPSLAESKSTISVTPSAATAIPAKSIAVLPFENLSADKNNAYFADGMQDLILTKLAGIGDLKVIARTSTAKYASHPDDLKTIAQQLGVATILEGSVQKAGNQVLINVQLIDANTDAHIWAESYQRNLHNIFDVEGEVAQKVAVALNARLTQTETARLSTTLTQNPQAYDLFLKAEYFTGLAYASFKASDFEAVVSNYRAAVVQDPKFALAWARLTQTESLMAWSASPVFGVNRGQLAAQAKQSVAQAEALAPDTVATQLAQGYYHLYVLTDLDGALSAFRAAIALEPNNAGALYGLGTTYYHLGKFQAAAEIYQKAAVLDPRNLNILGQLAHAYWQQHRYGQAEQIFRQSLAVDPTSTTYTVDLALVHIYAGDLEGAQGVLDAAPAAVRAESPYSRALATLMLYRRDYDGARRVLQQALSQKLDDRGRWTVEELFGDVEWAAGNQPQARLHYQRAATLLETALKQPQPWAGINSDLGWVYARLGRTQEALAQARLFLKNMQAAKSVEREQVGLKYLAAVQAQIGQADQAITGLDRMLAAPAREHISVPLLKLDPTWDPIRHDPRFQALLKKYAEFQPTPVGRTAAQPPLS